MRDYFLNPQFDYDSDDEDDEEEEVEEEEEEDDDDDGEAAAAVNNSSNEFNSFIFRVLDASMDSLRHFESEIEGPLNQFLSEIDNHKKLEVLRFQATSGMDVDR